MKIEAEKPSPNGIPTTLEDALTDNEARRNRNFRRIGIAFLLVIVVLAASGLLGQKTSIVTAAGNGYTLSVMYPSVVRPGMDVRLEITVSNPAGFGKSLTLALNRHYFDIFDLNSLRPDADSSTSDGTSLIYTWNSPPRTSFRFSLDMYAEYGEHLGLDGSTSVIARERPAVSVHYHTRLVP